MYETYYDSLQPFFGQKILQLHFIDTYGMILSMKTQKIIKGLKTLEDKFDFSNLDENQELINNKNIKGICKFKIETIKHIFMDEVIALRSNMYAYKCGNDSKNKMKGISISYSTHVKFEELKNV